MIDETLIRQWHQPAYRWSLTLCHGDKVMAEDVLQDVYVKMLEGKAAFRHQSSFQTWLFKLIKNCAIDYFRKKQVRKYFPLDEHLNVEEVDVTTAQYENEWETLMQKLSPMQRAILQLVFYHEHTLEEVADILDKQIGTVRTHYHRGKERLKEHIEKSGLESKLRYDE